jgi:transketolase N-terminal domain/subunit
MNPTITRCGPQLPLDQLRAAAAEMRAMDIVSIFAAGSGHPGGTLSIMDIAAALSADRWLGQGRHECSTALRKIRRLWLECN